MKLQLEVLYVDATSLVFKPINCALKGKLAYRGIPRRAIEQFKKGQIVEATIPLPDHYPLTECWTPEQGLQGIPCPSIATEPSATQPFETKKVDDRWFKRSPNYPHNWEPIQPEIDKALERVLRTGQPQVIARCGYVSTARDFIPYRGAIEFAV